MWKGVIGRMNYLLSGEPVALGGEELSEAVK